MMTSPVNNVKNADFVFLRKGRCSGKVFAFNNFINDKLRENPNTKFLILRVKDVKQMKNRDFKMRERYEQKEYFPDSSGMTRLEKILEQKAIRQAETEKTKWLKEREELK